MHGSRRDAYLVSKEVASCANYLASYFPNSLLVAGIVDTHVPRLAKSLSFFKAVVTSLVERPQSAAVSLELSSQHVVGCVLPHEAVTILRQHHLRAVCGARVGGEGGREGAYQVGIAAFNKDPRAYSITVDPRPSVGDHVRHETLLWRSAHQDRRRRRGRDAQDRSQGSQRSCSRRSKPPHRQRTGRKRLPRRKHARPYDSARDHADGCSPAGTHL